MYHCDFWTHGVNVEAEHTENRGLNILRTGFGAKIKQNRGTSNWFHLAIPSLSLLDGKDVYSMNTILRVDVNNDAVIKKVHVRKSIAGDSGYCSKIYDSGDINITGQVKSILCDYFRDPVNGPRVVCAYVEFEGDNGEIRFIGAGSRFQQVT